MPKWGIFNASVLLNEHGLSPFFISKLKSSYDIYSVGKAWTKIYCHHYFRGITLRWWRQMIAFTCTKEGKIFLEKLHHGSVQIFAVNPFSRLKCACQFSIILHTEIPFVCFLLITTLSLARFIAAWSFWCFASLKDCNPFFLELLHPFLRHHFFLIMKHTSSYCVIVRMSVVLKRTVVGDWRFDNLSGSHLQSQVNSVCYSMMLEVWSSLQDQMIRLPDFLHWWDWQKP